MAAFFQTLRARIVALVLACFVPSLVLFALVLWRARIEEQQSVVEDALRVAQLAGDEQAQVIDQTRRLLETLALWPRVRDSTAEDCSALMAEVLTIHPELSNLGRARPSGEAGCSAVPVPPGFSSAGLPHFQQALATGQPAISDFRISRVTHRPQLSMVVPVPGASGKPELLLLAGIELTWLSSQLGQLALAPRAAITVIDRNGIILARAPDAGAWIGRTMPEAAAIRAALAGHSAGTVILPDRQGARTLFSVAGFGPPDLRASLIIGIPAAVAFSVVDRLAAGTLIAALLSAVLLLVAVWFGSRVYVLRGLELVADAARRISGGDLSTRIGPVRQARELAALAHSIDEMAAALQASQAELQRSREQLSLALDAANEGWWDWDVQSGAVHYSERCETMLGYAPGETEHSMRGWGQLVHPEDRAAALAVFDAHLAGANEWYETEYRVRRKSGEWAWILDRGKLVERLPDGRPSRVLGTLSDISARKREEAELEAARAAAETATRAKSQFLAMMSHEVRTPLNGIIGFAELLAEADLPRDRREQARLIRDAGQTLLVVINDILDFSKIEAGKVSLEATDFSLGHALRSCMTLSEAPARAKGLSLELIAAPGLPERVTGDPTRLRQVLTNLLSNAVKFTARGGVTVRVGPAGPGPLIRFAVSDTGIGIAPDKQSRLFEQFSQAEASTTREYGGTGLGLAICRSLVTMMGGEIGLESRPGQGSTFWFTVALPPAARPAPEPAEPPAAAEPRRSRLRILVAEDVPVNQELARALLRQAGHEVAIAEDGVEAVAAVQAAPYDAVLMDMHMPHLDGLEATRSIRALPGPVGRIPIIALTASNFPEEIEKCRAAGMNGHVPKPIRKAALLAALEAVRAA
jgi:PAS domain S-box-containing protein